MGRVASTAISFIIRAVEILNFRVALIEMEMQIVFAIGADKQAGKHILFALVGNALAYLAALLLYLFLCGPVNNSFVNVFENSPILRVVFKAFFVFVGFAVSFEVDNIAAILLCA